MVLTSPKFRRAHKLIQNQISKVNTDKYEALFGSNLNLRLRYFELVEIVLICFYDQDRDRFIPLMD